MADRSSRTPRDSRTPRTSRLPSPEPDEREGFQRWRPEALNQPVPGTPGRELRSNLATPSFPRMETPSLPNIPSPGPGTSNRPGTLFPSYPASTGPPTSQPNPTIRQSRIAPTPSEPPPLSFAEIQKMMQRTDHKKAKEAEKRRAKKEAQSAAQGGEKPRASRSQTHEIPGIAMPNIETPYPGTPQIPGRTMNPPPRPAPTAAQEASTNPSTSQTSMFRHPLHGLPQNFFDPYKERKPPTSSGTGTTGNLPARQAPPPVYPQQNVYPQGSAYQPASAYPQAVAETRPADQQYQRDMAIVTEGVSQSSLATSPPRRSRPYYGPPGSPLQTREEKSKGKREQNARAKQAEKERFQKLPESEQEAVRERDRARRREQAKERNLKLTPAEREGKDIKSRDYMRAHPQRKNSAREEAPQPSDDSSDQDSGHSSDEEPIVDARSRPRRPGTRRYSPAEEDSPAHSPARSPVPEGRLMRPRTSRGNPTQTTGRHTSESQTQRLTTPSHLSRDQAAASGVSQPSQGQHGRRRPHESPRSSNPSTPRPSDHSKKHRKTR